MKKPNPLLLFIILCVIGIFALEYEKPQEKVIRPLGGIGFYDLETVQSNDFLPLKKEFYFIKDETVLDKEIFFADTKHFHIISHGYPSQYMFYVIDFMEAMYDQNIKDYKNIQEEMIEVHFYRDQKDYQRYVFDARFIAFTTKNIIHMPIVLEEDVFDYEEMYYKIYFAGIHELEHVFQYWHYGQDLKEYPQGWLLEVLANYKTFSWLDVQSLNLTGQDSFYITDLYSMMGNTWSYTYGFYLVDYLLEADKTLVLTDVLDEPNLETLTGKTKDAIFNEWVVFMASKYGFKYDSAK